MIRFLSPTGSLVAVNPHFVAAVTAVSIAAPKGKRPNISALRVSGGEILVVGTVETITNLLEKYRND